MNLLDCLLNLKKDLKLKFQIILLKELILIPCMILMNNISLLYIDEVGETFLKYCTN